MGWTLKETLVERFVVARISEGNELYGLIRPWARYVRLRCLGAWLTWMCLTTKLLVSRPLVSALASAFLRRLRRNSADLTGQRALLTPNCLPVKNPHINMCPMIYPSAHPRTWLGDASSACSRTLGSTASAPGVSPHWHGLLVLLNILEEGDGALELPAVDGLGGLAGVLERNTKVGAASAGGLGGLNLGGGVSDLRKWCVSMEGENAKGLHASNGCIPS